MRLWKFNQKTRFTDFTQVQARHLSEFSYIYTHTGEGTAQEACHCAGSGCAMCMVGACIGHPSWWVCNRRYSCFK